ncbi:MAG: hypothetical protein GX288_04435 [Clostridiales bacterium]|nr:hypothetical protein [Clostridiales bacterium]
MYFEPSKKTYYRFPSKKPITEHYMSLVFHDKNHHSSEDDLTYQSYAETNKKFHKDQLK